MSELLKKVEQMTYQGFVNELYEIAYKENKPHLMNIVTSLSLKEMDDLGPLQKMMAIVLTQEEMIDAQKEQLLNLLNSKPIMYSLPMQGFKDE